MSKLLNQIYSELDERASKNKLSTFEVTFALGAITIIGLYMPNNSFIYFYRHYLTYSLIGIILGILILVMMSKRFTQKFTVLYYFSIILITIFMSIWFIPKSLHYLKNDKNNVCVEAHLKYKGFVRYNNNGFIKFTLLDDTKLPIDLIFLKKINGLSRYDYDNLPKKGEKIRICGEISKIGFSFDYVEAVRDENVSSVP